MGLAAAANISRVGIVCETAALGEKWAEKHQNKLRDDHTAVGGEAAAGNSFGQGVRVKLWAIG